jgi:Icc-related predicted phosphoesterase
MTSQHLNRILCAGQPGDTSDGAERILEAASAAGAEVIALVGDLAHDPDGYRDLFRTLARARLPVYWVPGASDAPVDHYLKASYNIEVAFPTVRGLHGTAAFAPDTEVVFAGMGGEISDHRDSPREERSSLRYPRWEAAYRLKVLDLLDYNELVMLFATAPAHKGHDTPGSEAVAELVGTYRPRLVVCGGPRGVEILGRSLVVAPGSLTDGHYAVAEVHAGTAELAELSVAAR